MKLGLDTSILVRLLSGVPESSAIVALRFVTERANRDDELFASEWVVAEAYYALQHHHGASKKNTLAALRSFFATLGVQSSRELLEVLDTLLASAKPGFVDRVIHRAYLRSGMDEMVTFERSAAKRFPKVRVLAG